ncbi:DUF2290 domain-containing protein [Exiguobacterium sp. s59]|uniref:DUF2290 domain-containing protein n=1 Tax=Exiguobacterium sp. s59 TaxID=2751269 RepID=UPI001BE7203C|nr:DUF2290 domain-containing protein [Exiguobacterium sp. s59]
MSLSLGKLKTEYENAKRLLKVLGIKFEENLHKSSRLLNSDFSQEFKTASLKKDYFNCYKVARDNQDYNLLLQDYSFFQFGYSMNERDQIEELRYAYYEVPALIESYEEFLENLEFSIEEVGDDFFEDYQQFISETRLKNHVTSIRYDYNLEQAQEIVHPTSHLHIGQENDVRLPMSFVMTPQTFVAFVARHCYWTTWQEAIQDPTVLDSYLRIHTNNKFLEDIHFTQNDKKDIHFTLKTNS